MSAYVKTSIVSLWLLLTYILGQVGSAVGTADITIDWANFGWAVLGSTSYVIWEIVKPVPVVRPTSHRAGLVFIGITVSMALTNWVCKKWDLPSEVVATALAAGGYRLFTLGQKRIEKPGDLLSDLTKTNEEKP